MNPLKAPKSITFACMSGISLAKVVKYYCKQLTRYSKKKHTGQQFATEDSVNISKHKQLDIIFFLPESKTYIQFYDYHFNPYHVTVPLSNFPPGSAA